MAKEDSSEGSDDEKLREKRNDLDGIEEDKPQPKGGAGLELGDTDEYWEADARPNEFSDLREMEENNGFNEGFEPHGD